VMIAGAVLTILPASRSRERKPMWPCCVSVTPYVRHRPLFAFPAAAVWALVRSGERLSAFEQRRACPQRATRAHCGRPCQRPLRAEIEPSARGSFHPTADTSFINRRQGAGDGKAADWRRSIDPQHDNEG
jgi:hypothetical protein